MQYALVDSVRTLPRPGLRGTCCLCGSETLAKCGTIKIWHWSHVRREDCDPWWERESEWHRTWKNLFPESWREVVHQDSQSGERHIADVRTSAGTVIELQHSAIAVEERNAREIFYQNLIWIVDGRDFKDRFRVYSYPLPPPDADIFSQLKFNEDGGQFWPASPAHPGLRYISAYEREKYEWQIKQAYRGHHFFKWTRPRTTWLQSNRPVFIDFGMDDLYELQRISGDQTYCVRRIGKIEFLQTHGAPSIEA
ncbi:competence protein [Burkholderiales bacterium JOSHI_001]|nr:competence protein [Burkholderiales bacterium JOSHI_001]